MDREKSRKVVERLGSATFRLLTNNTFGGSARGVVINTFIFKRKHRQAARICFSDGETALSFDL
jgi:hypothetical protein